MVYVLAIFTVIVNSIVLKQEIHSHLHLPPLFLPFLPRHKEWAADVKIELTEDLDAETGLLMTKRRRSDEKEAEEEEEDQLDGDCEDDDIICDNYLPTPLNNAGRWNVKTWTGMKTAVCHFI